MKENRYKAAEAKKRHNESKWNRPTTVFNSVTSEGSGEPSISRPALPERVNNPPLKI